MGEKHTCKALFVVCMDFRIHETVRRYASENGLLGQFDLVSVAGTQRAFLDEDSAAVMMKQVKLSRQLHSISEVHLFAHQDCGAYGGSMSFAGHEAEWDTYTNHLQGASEAIGKLFPEMIIRRVVLTRGEDGGFAGWEVFP